MGPFEIHPGMKRTLTISGFLSADDRPAQVDGPPTHTSDNPNVQPTVTADGMSHSVANTRTDEDGTPMNVRVTMVADADRDPNVQAPITDFADYILLAPAGPVAAKFSANVSGEEAQ